MKRSKSRITRRPPKSGTRSRSSSPATEPETSIRLPAANLTGPHFLRLRVPEHRLLLPVRLHRHFNCHHGRTAQRRIAGEPVLPAQHIDEIALKVTALTRRQPGFFAAVVLRL